MTDHESDDKAFAAMSLAMPNLPPDLLFPLCSMLASPQFASRSEFGCVIVGVRANREPPEKLRK
jgi:hypothetical protein